MRHGWGLRRNDNWGNRAAMALFMEVLQVKGIVEDLVEGVRMKSVLPYLELQNDNRGLEDQDGVGALAHSRNRVFEEKVTIKVQHTRFQNADLLSPSIALRLFQGKAIASAQLSENLGF